jgi:hypothetical protein
MTDVDKENEMRTGVNVMIMKIFSPKKTEEKMEILTQVAVI